MGQSRLAPRPALGVEKTKPKPAFGRKSEARNPKRVERVRLKKQSQFAAGQIGVKSYMKGYYGNKPACGAEKNKANQACPEQRRMEPILRP
jgi:hypothetical protein